MKKYIVIIAAILIGVTASAADNAFGVLGGVNFPTQTKFNNVASTTPVGWEVGVAYRLRIGLGFYFQPELMYDRQTGSGYSEANETFVNYASDNLGLPLNFNWGPELGLFHPFIQISPFASYSLANAFKGENVESIYNSFANVDRLAYGLGLGFGVDIWKFQVRARYSWNLASQSSLSEVGVDSIISSISKKSCNGFNLSLCSFL